MLSQRPQAKRQEKATQGPLHFVPGELVTSCLPLSYQHGSVATQGRRLQNFVYSVLPPICHGPHLSVYYLARGQEKKAGHQSSAVPSFTDIHPYILLFNKYLLTIYLPGTVSGTWDIAVEKISKNPHLHGAYILMKKP